MRSLRFVSLIMLLALAGCAHTQTGTYTVEEPGPYLLDVGDTVRINVYGDEGLSDTYRVDDIGNVALPLVGRVKAKGVTTDALTRRVTSALANGYLHDPSVAIEIAGHRPFYIQGAVINSGEFSYTFGMTARAAVSAAGGFTPTANRSSVRLYRQQGSEMESRDIDLDVPILPGDNIVVSERWL
ncbi:MAG TPA: polysaccharide biosynthesis/export family protein [Pelagibacterium sp.]|uniref:polysaccharide biosynthesis/export family protein n=1 Tax=Pelagibacterium sp. TaxID=1967288 RepID=UPI002B87AE48|nr:polysaccharide biosynthesis/export family protein [Pelagibacterium sp.]HWJ87752.1 polysaccharide biosynthesis/export family protein [Pelagibacterium sp.]